jgi:hypothetical protein
MTDTLIEEINAFYANEKNESRHGMIIHQMPAPIELSLKNRSTVGNIIKEGIKKVRQKYGSGIFKQIDKGPDDEISNLSPS